MGNPVSSPSAFTSPSGAVYTWNKPDPPTQADVDAIVAYDHQAHGGSYNRPGYGPNLPPPTYGPTRTVRVFDPGIGGDKSVPFAGNPAHQQAMEKAQAYMQDPSIGPEMKRAIAKQYGSTPEALSQIAANHNPHTAEIGAAPGFWEGATQAVPDEDYSQWVSRLAGMTTNAAASALGADNTGNKFLSGAEHGVLGLANPIGLEAFAANVFQHPLQTAGSLGNTALGALTAHQLHEKEGSWPQFQAMTPEQYGENLPGAAALALGVNREVNAFGARTPPVPEPVNTPGISGEPGMEVRFPQTSYGPPPGPLALPTPDYSRLTVPYEAPDLSTPPRPDVFGRPVRPHEMSPDEFINHQWNEAKRQAPLDVSDMQNMKDEPTMTKTQRRQLQFLQGRTREIVNADHPPQWFIDNTLDTHQNLIQEHQSNAVPDNAGRGGSPAPPGNEPAGPQPGIQPIQEQGRVGAAPGQLPGEVGAPQAQPEAVNPEVRPGVAENPADTGRSTVPITGPTGRGAELDANTAVNPPQPAGATGGLPAPETEGNVEGDWLSKAAEEARARQKDRINRIGANPFLDPGLYSDALLIGADHIRNGAVAFGQWSQRVIADMGDRVKPILKDVWTDLQTHKDPVVAKLARAIDVAKPLRNQADIMRSQELGRKSGIMEGINARASTPEWAQGIRKARSGANPTPDFEMPPDLFHPDEVTQLQQLIRNTRYRAGAPDQITKGAALDALDKVLGGEIPQPSEIKMLEQAYGKEFGKVLRGKGNSSLGDAAGGSIRAAILASISALVHTAGASSYGALDEFGRLYPSITNHMGDLTKPANQIARAGFSPVDAIRSGLVGAYQGIREVPRFMYEGDNSIQSKLMESMNETYGGQGIKNVLQRGKDVISGRPDVGRAQSAMNAVVDASHLVGTTHGALMQIVSWFPGYYRDLLDQASVIAHNAPESDLQALDQSLQGKSGKSLRLAAKEWMFRHPDDESVLSSLDKAYGRYDPSAPGKSFMQKAADEGTKRAMMQENAISNAMQNARMAAKRVRSDEQLVRIGADTANAIIKAVQPTFHPATNVALTQIGETSPIGILRGMDLARRGDALSPAQNAAVGRLIGNGAVGTAVVLIGYYLAEQGSPYAPSPAYRGTPQDKAATEAAKTDKARWPISSLSKPPHQPGSFDMEGRSVPSRSFGMGGDLLGLGSSLFAIKGEGKMTQGAGVLMNSSLNPVSSLQQAGERTLDTARQWVKPGKQ